MEGYDVITSDDSKFGHVVGTVGDNLIVEHGRLIKARNALPRVFAHVDDAQGVVRVSVSKETLEEAPKVERDGEVDERAVAEHYGLAAAEAAPEAEGYGELSPDEMARSAEVQERRTGVETATEERLDTRKAIGHQEIDPAGGAPGPIVGPR